MKTEQTDRGIAIETLMDDIRTLRRELNEARKLVPRWIPVSERLPENGEFFGWSATSNSFARWKRDEGDTQLMDRFKRYGVTHWQPLPEPPKL